MPELQSLKQQQFAFTAYIRDPDHHPVPAGIEERRMAMYRELFFNNIESFLANGFPVLREILHDLHWLAMAEDFFARHRSQTPYFYSIPEEFLQYLQNERENHPEDPPFLLELAHYEWVELALSLAEGEAPMVDDAPGRDPLEIPLTVSELAWPLAYQFPVHRISPDFQPREPSAQPTCLVVYRDDQDEVQFVEINAVTYRLLELIRETPETDCRTHLTRIAGELHHPDPDVVIRAGADTLQGLMKRGILAAV